MAIRDPFRVDVPARGATWQLMAGATLAEIKRLLHLDEAGAARACLLRSTRFARRGAGIVTLEPKPSSPT